MMMMMMIRQYGVHTSYKWNLFYYSVFYRKQNVAESLE